MNPPEEHQRLVDEVHRKIGRNLMLLQHVEGMFKTLLILSRVSGTSPDEIARFRSKRKEMIERHTLGELAGKFTSEVLVKRGGSSSAIEPELPVGHFTFNYTVQADHAYVTQRSDSLKVIVDERNELVHHFLAKWDRLSLQSTQAASAYLDQQHLRVTDEAKTLKNHLESLQRLSRVMASPEHEKQMEVMWLQGSPIVLLLVEMSRAAVATDGWAGLAEAGQLLWTRATEDMASMKAMYGYNKLKPLLLASDIFDVKEDFAAKGGVRVLFKLKPEARAFYD
jgi:hypothetical protein